LAVLAKVLRVAPIELVFPLGQVDSVELFPGEQVPTWSAVKWFTGEGPLPALPIADLSTSRNPAAGITLELHREHERHLTEWSRRRQQALAARAAPRGQLSASTELHRRAVDEAESAKRVAEDGLRSIRQQMKRNGIKPPPLHDPELFYLDGE
jgi:hypothetical protein